MNRWVSLALVLLLLTVWRSEGFHQADEHFQILEFATYKAGGASAEDLPWEFDERMRPALQPAMAYVVLQALGGYGEANPYTVAFLLRLLSALLTAYVAYLLWRGYRQQFSGLAYALFVAVLLFHWIAYYNGVRFASENWSGLLAVLGFLAYPITTVREGQFTQIGGSRPFLAGVLFGLAFLCRYQIALLVGGFGIWLLLYQREWRTIALAAAGGVLTLAAAYPLTYWMYGEWTSPAWNYLAQNLLEGKAAGYGSRPWYAYFELTLLRGIPPLSLFYLGGMGYFVYRYRREPLTYMLVAFFVAHSVLARKDIRFLFPLLPLVPVFLAAALQSIQQRISGALWDRRWVRVLTYVSVGLNAGLLLFVVSRAAASEIGPTRFIYQNYPDRVTILGPEAQIVRASSTTSRFYHRPGYRVRQDIADTVAAESYVCAPPPCLYVTQRRGRPMDALAAPLVYTDRPQWADRLGLTEVVDRLSWWYVYELP